MAVTRGRRPKDLYEDWASDLGTLWSTETWKILQEAEKQKNKNKQKKKSSEIDVSTVPTISSVINDDQITTIGNSVDIAVDRITVLENRVSAVEAELQHKLKKRKIKIKIRG